MQKFRKFPGEIVGKPSQKTTKRNFPVEIVKNLLNISGALQQKTLEVFREVLLRGVSSTEILEAILAESPGTIILRNHRTTSDKPRNKV